MTMAIVFGSAEAKAILEKDRELRKLDEAFEEEVPKGDAHELRARLESLEFQIMCLEEDIAGMEDEAHRIRERLKEIGPGDKRISSLDVVKWNAWVKANHKPLNIAHARHSPAGQEGDTMTNTNTQPLALWTDDKISTYAWNAPTAMEARHIFEAMVKVRDEYQRALDAANQRIAELEAMVEWEPLPMDKYPGELCYARGYGEYDAVPPEWILMRRKTKEAGNG